MSDEVYRPTAIFTDFVGAGADGRPVERNLNVTGTDRALVALSRFAVRRPCATRKRRQFPGQGVAGEGYKLAHGRVTGFIAWAAAERGQPPPATRDAPH
jgi:hypothetical protein